MVTLTTVKGFAIFVIGVWLFEFQLDFKLPEENNQLLFFVAIPIIWAALTQIWTSYSCNELKTPVLKWASHLLSSLMLFGTVFIVSAVLNTIASNLDMTSIILFHALGWTAILGFIFYDIIDVARE